MVEVMPGKARSCDRGSERYSGKHGLQRLRESASSLLALSKDDQHAQIQGTACRD
jgi:hypothetical protein